MMVICVADYNVNLVFEFTFFFNMILLKITTAIQAMIYKTLNFLVLKIKVYLALKKRLSLHVLELNFFKVNSRLIFSVFNN